MYVTALDIYYGIYLLRIRFLCRLYRDSLLEEYSLTPFVFMISQSLSQLMAPILE